MIMKNSLKDLSFQTHWIILEPLIYLISIFGRKNQQHKLACSDNWLNAGWMRKRVWSIVTCNCKIVAKRRSFMWPKFCVWGWNQLKRYEDVNLQHQKLFVIITFCVCCAGTSFVTWCRLFLIIHHNYTLQHLPQYSKTSTVQKIGGRQTCLDMQGFWIIGIAKRRAGNVATCMDTAVILDTPFLDTKGFTVYQSIMEVLCSMSYMLQFHSHPKVLRAIPNAFIVYFVRDPRATAHSRKLFTSGFMVCSFFCCWTHVSWTFTMHPKRCGFGISCMWLKWVIHNMPTNVRLHFMKLICIALTHKTNVLCISLR